MMPFLIFYGDGSTFAGRPEDAPVRNVQCIAYPDENMVSVENVGRFVLCHYNFYLYSDKQAGWHACNQIHDLIDHLQDGIGVGGIRTVLTGRWIKREDYLRILKRAEVEGNFQLKSGKTFNSMEDGEQLT